MILREVNTVNTTPQHPQPDYGKFNLILYKAQVRFDWSKDQH